MFINIPCCCSADAEDGERCTACGSLNDDVIPIKKEFVTTRKQCLECGNMASTFTYPCMCKLFCPACATEYYETHKRCCLCHEDIENLYDLPSGEQHTASPVSAPPPAAQQHLKCAL